MSDDVSAPKRQKLHRKPEEQVVAILDCGAQYGKVIDRRVRELQVHSEIIPLDTPTDELRGYDAVIISGGPQSVYGPEAPKYQKDLFTVGVPILGICYGMQLMNLVHGGTVVRKSTREDGQFEIEVKEGSVLFEGVPSRTEVLLTHGDSVDEIAAGFKLAAVSNDGIVAAIENTTANIYGVQFHPEVDLTLCGREVLSNFLFKVAGLTPSFTLQSRKQKAVQAIKETVGNASVLVLVSGGVDSSVCAALLKEALPAEKIYAVHVDTGFMRLNESAKVTQALTAIGLHITTIDGAEAFYSAQTQIDGKLSERLDETVAPEVKRKIIGNTFIKLAEERLRGFGLSLNDCYLAQGTLRPDLIESASHIASSNASVIKTHHNDTEMVRALRDLGRIVEPLKDYHKDEVRQLGEELGLPHELVWRQPFPGPGLAIRIICCNEPFRSPNEDRILELLENYNTEKITATLLPCRTVGVQGDARSYSSLVGLSCDGEPDWSTLLSIAKEIPKKVHGVNRVVYVFGKRLDKGRLDGVTATRLQKDVIEDLQQADEIVNQALLKFDVIRKLSQVPVILFPVNFGEEGKRSVCIRTFITNDFMTGIPAHPGHHYPAQMLTEIVGELSSLAHISRVCYDLTPKPPATTEWE